MVKQKEEECDDEGQIDDGVGGGLARGCEGLWEEEGGG